MSDTTQQQSTKDAWNRERVDLVKRTICPRGISEDEFALFIEQCKRSGLDPLLKEAFCVGRRQNIGNRERPNWVTKHEFQPSETGMLARAERFPDFKGIQASAVFAEDEIVMDQGKGEVVHRFNPAKRKGSLVGAWSRVVRADKLPVVVWLDFSGYVQQTPLWAKIPTTMIEKCARVAALRKAYPEAFGGLYVREEMPQDEFIPVEPEPSASPRAAAQVPPPARTDMADVVVSREASSLELPAAMKQVVDAHAADTAASSPTKAEVVEGLRERIRELSPGAPASAPVDGTSAKPAGQSPVVVAFGPYKGKTMAELSDDELSATIDMAHEKLMEQPRARWAKAMRENLTALEAETELRCRVPAREQAAPSPGRTPRTPRAARPEGAQNQQREPGSDDEDDGPSMAQEDADRMGPGDEGAAF